MKFTAITLIFGLCVLAASVNANVASVEVDSFSDEYVEIETFGFLRVVKAALRSLKGINCTIKEVLVIKAAAQQFITDVQACGGVVSQKVQNVINICQSIINICNNIININDTVCNNADQSDDNTATPPKNCTAQLVKQVWSLYKNIKKGISAIKKIPSTAQGTSQCVVDASTKLNTAFVQFPSNITTCSKLTSN